MPSHPPIQRLTCLPCWLGRPLPRRALGTGVALVLLAASSLWGRHGFRIPGTELREAGAAIAAPALPTSGDSASVPDRTIPEEAAVARVMELVQEGNLYADHLRVDCLTFLPSTAERGGILVEVRERASSRCGPQVNGATLVDTFWVQGDGSLFFYHVQQAEFVPYVPPRR